MMSDSTYDSDSDDNCNDGNEVKRMCSSSPKRDVEARRGKINVSERRTYSDRHKEMETYDYQPNVGLPHQGRAPLQASSHQKSQGQTQNAILSNINLKVLESWATADNSTILVSHISHNIEGLQHILHLNELPVEWMCHLLTILKKISHVKAQKVSVDEIITIVFNSNLFGSQLKYFLQALQHHETLRSQSFSIMQNLFDVIDYGLKFLPQSTQICYSSLLVIDEEGRNLITMRDGSNVSLRFSHLLGKATGSVPHFQQQTVMEQQRARMIPRPDDESPLDDFSCMTIFPDLEELEASFEPFLRANKTSGPYRDVQHYTDVHFRLLREDYLSPIRNGLKAYKDALQIGELVKSNELRFYYNVQLVQMRIGNSQDGINFMVKFDIEGLKEVNWELTKRFMQGTLLCFSKDDFESVIFATVAYRDPETLAKGQVKVAFESNLEDVFTTSEYDVYVMAETVSLFVSYRHVLEGLQEVKDLPLSDYIIKCDKDILPPCYLTEDTRFDISPILKGYDDGHVSILEPGDWPDPEETILNASQLEALQLAFTNELSVIQGPPGTGKTFVGLKIMELILKNRDNIDSITSPILVVCHSNHALDQFLEGILEFCPEGIVRVGGMSRSEILKKFNLMELTRNQKINRSIKKSIERDLDFSKRRLGYVCRQIRALWHDSLKLETTVLTVDDLKEEINQVHLASLNDESRTDGDKSKIMSRWMKAAKADMEKHLKESARRHLTKMIIGEGEMLEDNGLLSKQGLVRPDFETRIRIYRWWLYNLRKDLEERHMIFVNQGTYQDEEYYKLLREKEECETDILPDDVISKYMTNSEVYNSIKRCVEMESKCGEPLRNTTVKSWLLDYYVNTDQMLDAIAKLSRTTQAASSKYKKEEEENRHDGGPVWVVGDSDSEDENYMGFNIRDDDDEDEEEPLVDKDISRFKLLEADFKISERKEILLLQKAKLLNIDLDEVKQSPHESRTNNTMSYSEIFKLIYSREPFSEEEVPAIQDVWALSLPERYRLYKYWMMKRKTKNAQKIIQLTETYNHFLEMKKTALSRKKIAILKGAQVIGMTTTGAAKNRKVLKRVAAQIIIVEEAAEVLEAHIITTLNKNCKHLILIGDHQQLRPNPTVFQLAKTFKLEISLFERLVKNQMPMAVLDKQHRMRPEIANYVRLIYPHLVDHETVLHYENVKGVTSNVFFLHHEYEERNIVDSTSKENIHEATFLRELCKYFLHHGYTGHQITILAAYGGQVDNLKEYMQTNEIYEYVKITSIDNYQGEENDIILLSLVRSNMLEEVGFLKTDNRVCVALSRARRGLFVIGNLRLLATKSELWRKIVEKATRTHVFGRSMKLKCINHEKTYSSISTADEFRSKVPEGGCDLPCNAVLNCGHICPRMCHASDRNHQEQICHQQCLETCAEGHPCEKECFQDCGLCETLVEKVLQPCGHKDLVACFETEDTALCRQTCGQKQSCGHICKGFCGDCRRSDCHSECEEKVELEWPTCSHVNKVPCHTDVKLSPCPDKCSIILNCGHKCGGTCGECLGGKVHKVCSHQCEKTLPCGHRCSGKCGSYCDPCPLKCLSLCRHGACSKTTCGEPCDSCMEDCALVCKHQRCNARCADECSRQPCKRKCPVTTKCQHACSSLCGEECVCLTCELKEFTLLNFSKMKPGEPVPVASKDRALKYKLDKDTTLMKISPCGHIFTVGQLDQYVRDFDPDGSYYLRCPRCPATLQGIMRYSDEIRSRALRRENRKFELLKTYTMSESETDDSQSESSQSGQLNCNSSAALECHGMFDSALEKIKRMHEHFNWTVELNIGKWELVVESIETRVTNQFIEELSMEFHRLLISEQLVALKRMIDDVSHSLQEPLKSRCRMKKRLNKKMTLEVKENAENVLADLYQFVSSLGVNNVVEQELAELRIDAQIIASILANIQT